MPSAAPSGASAQATERLLGSGISAFSVVLLLQALGLVIAQVQGTGSWWVAIFLCGILAVFVCSVIASVRGRSHRTTHILLLVMVSAGFSFWRLAAPPNPRPEIGTPWLWADINVSAVWVAFAAGTTTGCLYALATGAVFIALRTTAQVEWASTVWAGEDTLFATTLALVICSTIGVLRQAAVRLDEAADEAIRQYTLAASATALSGERLRLDGLLHDSVMAALLTAANARSHDEYDASSLLAHDALERLERYETNSESSSFETVTELVARIRFTVDDGYSDIKVSVTCHSPTTVTLPATVAKALFEATTEAVRNSTRHSGAKHCGVNVVAGKHSETNQILIQIQDNGRGFDENSVSNRRLGIRVSILGRLRSVGGSAKVRSKLGSGTEVDLQWEGAST
jgi:signal transduction histidine kinase